MTNDRDRYQPITYTGNEALLLFLVGYGLGIFTWWLVAHYRGGGI